MNYFRKGSHPQLFKNFVAVVKSFVSLSLIGLPEGSVTPVVTLIFYSVLVFKMLAGSTVNVVLSSLRLGSTLVIGTQALKLSVDVET